MEPLRLTRRQSREVDRIAIEEYGIPGIVLMENAAAGLYPLAFAFFADVLPDGCTVLCGKGNNGGDGLALARRLHVGLQRVRVLLTDPADQFTGDAATQLRIVRSMGLAIEPAAAFLDDDAPIGGVVVDAVYGTGFRLPSRIDFRPLNRRVRLGGAKVLAVDVPSGMDADTGEVTDTNAVLAHVTGTMMTEKAGFGRPGAERFTGRVWTVDLGIPAEIALRASQSPA